MTLLLPPGIKGLNKSQIKGPLLLNGNWNQFYALLIKHKRVTNKKETKNKIKKSKASRNNETTRGDFFLASNVFQRNLQ